MARNLSHLLGTSVASGNISRVGKRGYKRGISRATPCDCGANESAVIHPACGEKLVHLGIADGNLKSRDFSALGGQPPSPPSISELLGIADGTIRAPKPRGLEPAGIEFGEAYVESAVQVGVLSSKPCVLAGHGVESSDQLDPQIYGTDLGFVVAYKNKTYLLFGDTWTNTGTGGPVSTPNGLGGNNDAMAYTEDKVDPKNGFECPRLTFLSVDNALDPIKLNPPVATLEDNKTPAGAFATSRYIYGAFSARGEIPFSGGKDLFEEHLFIGYSTGEARFDLTGYPFAYGHPEQFLQFKYPDNVYLADMFATVAFAVPPADFPPVEDIKRPIFVWGRAIYWKVKDPQFESLTNVYLMVLDGDQLDALQPISSEHPFSPVDLKRYYYVGKDAQGEPLWGTGPDATPQPLIYGKDDITYINQTSVTYDPRLQQWVMLYGGGAQRESLPAGSLAPNDPDQDGIYIRLSSTPWGDWSDPIPILKENQINCQTFFDPDAQNVSCDPVLEGPLAGLISPYACRPLSCVQPDIHLALNLETQTFLDGTKTRGFSYGVSFWTGANFDYSHKNQGKEYEGSTFYFVVSTWNPYHVVLMKASLGLLALPTPN